MTSAQSIDKRPVTKQLLVHLPRAQAFELFTTQMSRWWPLASHSCAGAAALSVCVEPRVGGQVLEHGPEGSTHAWGTVLLWDPPNRFAMSWHPGVDPDLATRLEVSFTPVGASCRVDLVHSGWESRGADSGGLRDRYEAGWGPVLSAYLAQAEAPIAV